jgi:isoleucyl-tRNA synthetase
MLASRLARYQATLCLPKTSFPMRANAPQREPRILQACISGAYEELQRAREDAPTAFVLHDGPPYANGPLHLGHVLNKTLKDIAVRWAACQGQAVNFIPGWDCHGLPIELAALSAAGKAAAHGSKEPAAGSAASSSPASGRSSRSAVDIRRLARAHAELTIERQSRDFQRLGVLADWNAPYVTMSPSYEAAQIRLFGRLVEQGMIYRQYKPVHWSPTTRTALAEAELEYEDYTSPSAYVAFELAMDSVADDQLRRQLQRASPVSLLAWTTTPWTLPANQALAVNPALDYVLCSTQGRRIVVARDRVEVLRASVFGNEMDVELAIPGAALVGSTVRHPWLEGQEMGGNWHSALF